MEVRLKRGWLGHRSGTIVRVTENCANTLFQGDAAEMIVPENQVDIKAKLRAMVARRRVKPLRPAGRERGVRN